MSLNDQAAAQDKLSEVSAVTAIEFLVAPRGTMFSRFYGLATALSLQPSHDEASDRLLCLCGCPKQKAYCDKDRPNCFAQNDPSFAFPQYSTI